MKKIKMQLTIALGQYENAKPEINVDLDNLEEAKKDILKLWDAFHNLVQFRPNPSSLDDQDIQYQKEDKNTVEGQIEANTSVPQGTSMKFRPDSMKVNPASKKQINFIKELAKERGVEVNTDNMDSWQASQKIRELKEISVVETDEVIQKVELDLDLDTQFEADQEKVADLK